MALEGVGRRGRLAVRFTIPRQELASLAAAHAIEVRFADKAGQEHAASFAPEGLEEALTIAQEHLSSCSRRAVPNGQSRASATAMKDFGCAFLLISAGCGSAGRVRRVSGVRG